MSTKSPLPAEIVPTLADVAQRAGVSTATVSRCLNSPNQVHQKTRKRVMAAVDELGYSPNFSARSLAVKRTNTIGAIIPTMDNAIFARGIQAFQEELGRSGATLLVASSSYKPDLEAEQVRTLIARGADGLLLIGHQRDPKVYDFIDRRNVPVLVSWAFNTDQTRPSIGFDNHAAMKAMADKVLEMGHRDIAVISAWQADNDRARERVLGIRAALRDVGLDADNLNVVETDYSIEKGGEGFAEIMSAYPRPTAVICGNDVLAVGAMQMAQTMGLRVPDDVSITGFDDIELAKVTTPALTTVHVPHREMGRRAAQHLWRMMGGALEDESQCLETELRLRGTLAGPAAAE